MSPLRFSREPVAVHSVGLVVDRNFGRRLLNIADRLHVWIVESPENRLAAEEVWSRTVERSLERGATIFSHGSESPDVIAAGVLSNIELHHGEYGHTPPVSRLEIHGASRTAGLVAALQELGFVLFEDFPGGFMASRTGPAENLAG